MGGSSLSGMFGGPSTLGSNANAPGNTTPGVMGAMGKLEAFDPGSMAGTYNTPTTPTMANLTSSGTDAQSGLPSYITNFLQSGGSGALAPPQYTMDPGAGVQQAGTAVAKPITKANIPIKPGGAAPAKTAAPAPTAAGAAGSTAPQYTMIPFNAPGGYNQPGLQQPMAVSDQYNMWQGGSNQIASPAPGGGFNAPQVMGGGIYLDGKGGYFAKDPSGKMVPISDPRALAAAKGVAQSFGYR